MTVHILVGDCLERMRATHAEPLQAMQPRPPKRAAEPRPVSYTDALAWFRQNASPDRAGRYADMAAINALRKAKGKPPFPSAMGGLLSPVSLGAWG